ncbi:hypothetical protein [Lysinibacter sp. HNR]|uniref:hypothetical protein n=1 Tax=Lysinibacter sp. HNR TaxID=3031408 RepID=UPI002434AE03|nr:hypothetical protein [Lysinibacter sp. HNR]WGD37807.1 hypothetical protein FrondiHNR_02520 [Lysinibacter sp. HNR]
MTVRLASRGRVAIAAIPIAGFFSTPFFPFAQEPTLWFGLPAVMVWFTGMIVLSVASLQVIERSYMRDGGGELDRLEKEGKVP